MIVFYRRQIRDQILPQDENPDFRGPSYRPEPLRPALLRNRLNLHILKKILLKSGIPYISRYVDFELVSCTGCLISYLNVLHVETEQENDKKIWGQV